MGNTQPKKNLDSNSLPPLVNNSLDTVDKLIPEVSQASEGCPMKLSNQNSTPSGCPMHSTNSSSTYKNPNQYNVYSQKIDPTNQMPAVANQAQAPGQLKPLETQRVPSTIPKGGTDDQTWTYPSPQMFWNALVRKQKVDGASEDDMDTVVAIHNNMNETTWKQVLSWEALHPATSSDREPKLLRFTGKPDTLSPKARLKSLFGHPEPFDRHDWIVDRGGKEVRYVIDYYHDENQVTQDERPKHLHDVQSMKSIKVDVRPALDSVESIMDRLVSMPLLQWKGTTWYSPPPFFVESAQVKALQAKKAEMNNEWSTIQSKCQSYKEKLSICNDDESCGAASVALQRCTASIICPTIVEEFDASVTELQKIRSPTAVQQEKVTFAYNKMEKCLDLFKIESQEMSKTK